MGLFQPCLGEITAVFRKTWLLGIEGVQGFIRDGDQLGAFKCGGTAQRHQEAEAFALHGLVGGIGRVLVGTEHGIDKEPVGLVADLLHTSEVGKQRFGRFAQFALIGSQLLRKRSALRQRLAPCLFSGINILHCPAVFFELLTSQRDFFLLHTLPPSAAKAACFHYHTTFGGKEQPRTLSVDAQLEN